MRTLLNKLMATPVGTFAKTFLSTVLTLLVAGGDLLSLDMHGLKVIGSAAFLSALPVLANWLNPQYTGYGVQPKVGG